MMPMTRVLLGLLTRIRLPGPAFDLQQAARQQHLFPLIGMIVGALATVLCVALGHLFDRGESMISSALLLAGLYAITGIIHTEGLADLADGAMTGGDRSRKLAAMKDPHTGAAALIAVVLCLLILFSLVNHLCIRSDDFIGLTPFPWTVPVAVGFVVAEVSGKLAMNTSMLLGPSSHSGMGSAFVENATGRRYAVALLLAFGVCTLIVGLGSVILLAGIASGAAVTLMARRHFGGVSGDVFGAANEVGRVSALLLWVMII